MANGGRITSLPDLLKQRERLIRDINDEELREVEVFGSLRHRIALAEGAETQHRESHHCEFLACQHADEVEQELAVASSELADAMRLRESTMATEENERQRVESWASKIRSSWQEYHALESSQQMASAHLKALETMAASRGAEVDIRGQALLALERDLQEHESDASTLSARAEVAECKFQRTRAEMSLPKESSGSPTSMSATQKATLAKLEADGDQLQAAHYLLQKELQEEQAAAMASGQEIHRVEGRLWASINELQKGCEVTVRGVGQNALRPPALETEAARVGRELDEELQLAVDVETAAAALSEAHRQVRSRASMRMGQLEGELSEERAITEAAAMHLAVEEHALLRCLATQEMRQRRLVAEARDHDEHFSTIFRELEFQIASLRTEEAAIAPIASNRVAQQRMDGTFTGIGGQSVHPSILAPELAACVHPVPEQCPRPLLREWTQGLESEDNRLRHQLL